MWAQAAPTPFPVPCLWCYEVTCLAHVTLLVQVLPLGFPANRNVNRLLFYDKSIRRHLGKESRAVPRYAMAGTHSPMDTLTALVNPNRLLGACVNSHCLLVACVAAGPCLES
jgi:hypothetical protein